MRLYIVRNTNYSLKFRFLLHIANFLDGLISVLSLGIIGSTFVLDTHRNASKDAFTRLKRTVNEKPNRTTAT